MANELTLKKEHFSKIEGRFIELTDQKTFAKECSFAMQHFSKNDYLDKSTIESKLQAVLNVAQVQLTLNPVLKLAYLVPRFENGAVKCFLEPSYQGLVKLITDTGSAKNVTCHPVYEGDIFDVTLGTSEDVVHNPKFKSKEIEYVYAIAVLSDGRKQIEVMTAEQVNEIRDKSESYKSFVAGKTKTCIWNDHYGEMARKTVIKRLVKYLPKTEQWERLATAIDLDNQDYSISYNQVDYIESLLLTANIDEVESSALYRELPSMTAHRAETVIEYLKNNQVDPITAGMNYNQGDIKLKLTTES
mgnify:CR=1 FL=1